VYCQGGYQDFSAQIYKHLKPYPGRVHSSPPFVSRSVYFKDEPAGVAGYPKPTNTGKNLQQDTATEK
jgi:hypothetical protein